MYKSMAAFRDSPPLNVDTNKSPKILVVDDQHEIRNLLGRHLQKHSFSTTPAKNAAEARELLKDKYFDLVLLDIMMPGEDGISLCRHLRESSEIPVILMSALSEETDRIVGLEMGADDYLTKPFSPRELVARIRNVLRRTYAMPPQIEPRQKKVYQFEDWTFDADQRKLKKADGESISLSAAEYSLMLLFVGRPRHVFSRDQLLDLTQGKTAKAFDRSIDNQISRLRKKVEVDPKEPELIQTVWGGGYRFSADVTDL